jgi:hypothetical protein
VSELLRGAPWTGTLPLIHTPSVGNRTERRLCAGGPHAGRIVGISMAAAFLSGCRQNYVKQTVNDDWNDD